MPKRLQVAVLGLGRFGSTVATELTRLGHEVLAVDSNPKIVQDLADQVTHAVQADITSADTLEELGLAGFETVVVATSSSLEVSVLVTVMLRERGARRIIAKAANRLHGSILEQVGAARVVYPEREMGIRVAHSIAAPGVRDYLDVGPGYGLARIGVPAPWIARSIGELDLRRTCGVTILALYRAGAVTLNPDRSEVLRADDELIVAGLDEDLERMPASVPPVTSSPGR